MVRSESADEDHHHRMKMEMMDEMDDDCLDVDTVDDVGMDAAGAVRVRAWTDAGGRVMGGSGGGSASVSPGEKSSGGGQDVDRRIRRQIANCNERRRMQSINAGFQSLRALLPRKEGEKLSKAAILQQTAELIQQLRAERSRFLERTGSADEDTISSGTPSAVWKKPRLERESDSFESIPSSSSSSAASSQNNIAAVAAAQQQQSQSGCGGGGDALGGLATLAAAAAAGGGTAAAAAAALVDMPTVSELLERESQMERERVMRLYLETKLLGGSGGGSAASTPTPLSPIPHSPFGGALAHLALQNSPLLDSTTSRLLAAAAASSSSDLSPLSTMAAAAALAAAADSAQQQQQGQQPNLQQLQQAQQGTVIRPTPTQPLRVDVSLANLVTLSNSQQPQHSGAQPTAPLPSVASVAASPPPSGLTHRSLNAILEAIRHLEGVNAASSPPPSAHSNLLVR